MNTDNYGYAISDGWTSITAEHNDALVAAHHSMNPDHNRVDEAEAELKKLRRKIEDRLRKDRFFLYEVAAIFDN